MKATCTGDENEETDSERRRDYPNDCAGGFLWLLTVSFKFVFSGGGGAGFG
jgi:hypothetical protein